MHSFRAGLVFAAAILALGGCASPTIVIGPALPMPAPSPSAAPAADVRLDVREGSTRSQFEEKSDKTHLGRSESLGVHLSDFWMEEPPARFVQRVIEINLKAWGHRVVQNGEQVQMRGEVSRFSLTSRAISAFEFQADGVIDVLLEVIPKLAGTGYRQQYLATCTFRTATSVPGKENMERMFNQCVDELQKRISTDGALRAALAGNR